MLNRARILLEIDVEKHAEGKLLVDRRIAPLLETSIATVQRVRERFCKQGLDAALERSMSDRECTSAPSMVVRGLARSRLPARRRPRDEIARARCRGGGLPRDRKEDAQKNELRPHLVKGWVIPPKESAWSVWRMEEILDLYEEPCDPKCPVVCFDERPCQFHAEVREPLRLGAGRPERRDHEYERRGMAHLFVAFEPLTDWRGVEVRERRRGREVAEFMRYLAEDLYP